MTRALQIAALLAAVTMAAPAYAGIVKIDITSREIFAGGVSFGAAGPYERLTGIAYGEVDPADPHNAAIVNLDKAPRNARGKVEYDTDIFILRPVDPAKGNGALLYEVNNRGMKLLSGVVMGATPNPDNPLGGFNDPRTVGDVGDGLLLHLGYTLVWSGWDPNAPQAPAFLRMRAPIAMENGKPIERTIRDEWVGGHFMRGTQFQTSYEVAALEDQRATLTQRWRAGDKGTAIPRNRWRFKDARTLELLPEGTKPQHGALYELHYRAEGPHVAGLGFAATRDLITHLRDSADSVTPGIERTLAIGFSQSARYLRGFVAQGFNRNERDALVFDGMLAHIGGAGKVFLNAEFSQPSRTNTQGSDHGFPDFDFPYSTARLTDLDGKRSAGILRGDDSDPLFMEVNTSTEYWQKAASLIATDPAGTRDAELPTNARAYFLPGLPHAPLGMLQSELVHPVNLLTPTYVIRSLLVRLDAWVANGTVPPDNALPRIDQRTLVRRDQVRFPKIPGVDLPAAPNSAQRIADWIEPRIAAGPHPRVLVPQTDADGQDLGGVRIAEVAVPLGTSIGWNLFKGPERAGAMGNLAGSFIPFAKTKAERLARRDPRPSLEERYGTKAEYVARFRKAIDDLVKRGFVRAEDADRYAEVAMRTQAFD